MESDEVEESNNNHQLVQTALLSEGAHESSVVSVVYPNFFNGSNGTSEKILCSAGSDASILFWDLGSSNNSLGEWGDKAEIDHNNNNTDQCMDDVTTLFARSLCIDPANRMQEDTPLFGQAPSVLFGIPHGQKMNWVTRAERNFIFVADTSQDITCYTIPMR